MTARAFRGRKDAESVALVRQLMPDVPSCASGPRNGAMSPSAGACEEKKLGALDGDRSWQAAYRRPCARPCGNLFLGLSYPQRNRAGYVTCLKTATTPCRQWLP